LQSHSPLPALSEVVYSSTLGLGGFRRCFSADRGVIGGRGRQGEKAGSGMSGFEWKESFSVGCDIIDADHKILISLINQLDDAMETGQARDVVASVLNVLIEYTETHFGREEKLMEISGYPGIEAHKTEHARLTAQVRDIRDRFQRGERRVVDEELMSFLKTWLSGHILGIDMQYRPYIEKADYSEQDLILEFNDQEDD
jgi:hemerythrin